MQINSTQGAKDIFLNVADAGYQLSKAAVYLAEAAVYKSFALGQVAYSKASSIANQTLTEGAHLVRVSSRTAALVIRVTSHKAADATVVVSKVAADVAHRVLIQTAILLNVLQKTVRQYAYLIASKVPVVIDGIQRIAKAGFREGTHITRITMQHVAIASSALAQTLTKLAAIFAQYASYAGQVALRATITGLEVAKTQGTHAARYVAAHKEIFVTGVASSLLTASVMWFATSNKEAKKL